MSVLSAQTISYLCRNRRMVDPFTPEKIIVRGKSYGLSAATYGVRIAHDLMLWPDPIQSLQKILTSRRLWSTANILDHWVTTMKGEPNHALAHTEEDFHMPDNICGVVMDKSTYARQFMSAMNTFIDPGFQGNLTLELVNHGPDPISLNSGDPIAQILFLELDQATNHPYDGKYQHQTKAAHPARYEDPAATG